MMETCFSWRFQVQRIQLICWSRLSQQLSWGFALSQLAFKKIDDEDTTVGGNVNQTPSGRIVSIMVLDLVPHHLELWDVVLYFTI